MNLQANLNNKLKQSKWYNVIGSLINSSHFNDIVIHLKKEGKEGIAITPPPNKLLSAFEKCPYDKLKVVIIGQDPYPQKGVANGVAFCCSSSSKIEKSLRYINISLCDMYNLESLDLSDLTPWCNQGVLLLNAAFTCQVGKPGSHQSLWFNFTASLISTLSLAKPGLIYVFLGKESQKYSVLVDDKSKCFHLPHPASAAYRGGRWDYNHIWEKINDELRLQNKPLIQWIPNS
jgi:uracil-DNA glycosylase